MGNLPVDCFWKDVVLVAWEGWRVAGVRGDICPQQWEGRASKRHMLARVRADQDYRFAGSSTDYLTY